MKNSRAFRSLFILFTVFAVGIVAINLQRPTANSEEESGPTTAEEKSTPTDEEVAEIEKLEELIKPPKTADELLKRLDSQEWLFQVPDGELPDEEIEKAAKKLRARFPFVSIRDRVNQLKHKDADKPDSSQKRIVQAQIQSLQLQVTSPHLLDTRTQALIKLHSDEVHAFINRGGNGFGRLPSVTPYNLKEKPLFVKRLDTVPVSSDMLREPTIRLERVEKDQEFGAAYAATMSLTRSGMPTVDLTEQFHQQFSYEFTNDLGYFKSVDEVAGFNSHQLRMNSAWNRLLRSPQKEQLKKWEPQPTGLDTSWKANQLQLVSLLLHEEPGVYVSENLPDMEELSGVDVEVRNLNSFEDNSLAKLFKGEDVVSHATTNRIEMLGALRATNNCLQCHDVKENTLLGAFSYEFLRDPMVEVNSIDKIGWYQPTGK